MKGRLEDIERENILSEMQGFRKDRRTSDHIFTLLQLIEKAKMEGKRLYRPKAFLDLKKAYDTRWTGKQCGKSWRDGDLGESSKKL